MKTPRHPCRALQNSLPCLAALMLTIMSPQASAQINKCVVAGRVVYSDQPCDRGGQSVKIVPNTVDGTHLREESQRIRTERAIQEQEDAQQRATQAAISSRSTEQGLNAACEDARRGLESAFRSKHAPTIVGAREAVRAKCNTERGLATSGDTAACDEALHDLQVRARGGYMPDVSAAKARATAACGTPAPTPSERQHRKNIPAHNCDAQGCNSEVGRFNRLGNSSSFASPNGGVCQLQGTTLRCP